MASDRAAADAAASLAAIAEQLKESEKNVREARRIADANDRRALAAEAAVVAASPAALRQEVAESKEAVIAAEKRATDAELWVRTLCCVLYSNRFDAVSLHSRD
eukprot:COSAG02_NODE_69_length_42323_cov_23.507850_41_plen_104_part_00